MGTKAKKRKQRHGSGELFQQVHNAIWNWLCGPVVPRGRLGGVA